MFALTKTEDSDKRSSPRSPFRYVLLALIVVSVSVVYLLITAQFSISGKPAVDMLVLLAIANMALYLWVRLVSGWKLSTHIRAIAALILIQGLFFALIQMEGIQGNGRPICAWRWASLPADSFSELKNSNEKVVDINVDSVSMWPQFRGIKRDGISKESISSWDQSPPQLLWKQPIGSGWSSFATVDSFCITQEQRASTECIVCYEIETGQQVWCNSSRVRFSELTGGEGPRATPTYHKGYLYALGATGILKCVKAVSGETRWETDILAEHETSNCLFGMCGSPLVTNGMVIVSPGGEGSSLVAHDLADGTLIWKAGNADASYSSPIQMTIADVEQVLIFNGDGLYSHSTNTGEIIWSIDWVSNEREKNNVCQPIQLSNTDVFISSAYGMGSARYRIENVDGILTPKLVWKNQNLKSKFSSAVFHENHIYGLDLGIMVCLDAMTGVRKWKEGRYAHGQIVKAGDYLIVQSEKGYLAQVQLSPNAFFEVAKCKALKHRTWTHPAISNGVLLIRNDREMAAFRID